MSSSLRILSFNVGLTRLKFVPFDYNFVPNVKERVQLLSDALLAEGADIICLQEVFESGLFQKIQSELVSMYPYAHHENKGWKLFNKGLAVFSKLPFEPVEEVSFRTLGWEKFAQKGASIIRLKGNTLAGLVLANVHFPYGGYIKNTQAFTPIVTLRNRAIEHLHETLLRLGTMVVLVGDFNFGPTMAQQNYEYILSLGYQNVTQEAITWDSENPLNKFFSLMKSQSLDHIFAHSDLMQQISATNSTVLFKQPIMTTDGKSIHLSDHYAVATTFNFQLS